MMDPVELEALVGHIFIVGGRSVRSASPGTIAMPAPRRAARGRDRDTFFGLVSLSEAGRQPASFYEKLIQQVSTGYFDSSGSVTAALRNAISDLNSSLLTMNSVQPDSLSVGLACVIMREQEIYIAIAGPARCFLIQGGKVERLPSDEDMVDGAMPLGLYNDPDVRYFRVEVQPGDFLIICDSSLNRLDSATLIQAISSGDMDQALNNLTAVAGEFTSAEVIKFISSLEESELPSPTVVAHEAEQKERRPKSGFPGMGKGRQSQRSSARTESDGEAVEGSIDAQEVVREPGAVQKVGHRMALGLAKASGGTRQLFDKMTSDEDVDNPLSDRFHLSLPTQIGLAIAIAIIVALITTFVYRTRGVTTQYDQLVREALAEVELARAGGSQQIEARPHWETAVFLLEEAAKLRVPSQEKEALKEEALAALDSYDHVTRVSPIQLREYDPGAVLKSPVVQGLSIYVLDETSDIIYREELDQTGQRLVNRELLPIARQGQQIDDQVVGGVIDITWVVDGGVRDRNVLAAITRNGLLITYSPTSDVHAYVLPRHEAWIEPRALAIFDRDLYILDSGANEIWRYEAEGDAYLQAPQRYFADSFPQLGDAIDIQIDTNGNLYILRSGGQISKYFLGREEPFTLEGLPQPLARPSSFYLSLGISERAFYIGDPGGSRIYTTATSGVFIRNLKDVNGDVFTSVTGLFSDEATSHLYLVAANGLYYFPTP
jgi:hypothetical protein